MTSYLNVSGTKIVDGDGNEVILRGAGLGGWMKYVPPRVEQVGSSPSPRAAWRTSYPDTQDVNSRSALLSQTWSDPKNPHSFSTRYVHAVATVRFSLFR